MPMNWELYPANWKAIANEVKTRAGWRCQICHVACYGPGEAVETRKLVLTTAHLDHDPTNHWDARLCALCAPCHLRYDGKTLFGKGDYEPAKDRLPGIDWEVPFIRICELSAYEPLP